MEDAKDLVSTADAGASQVIARGETVFDETTFLEYAGGDAAVARQVVQLFLADIPARLGRIHAALGDGDVGGVIALAHSLKGSVSFLAAPAALAAVCRLESIALTGDRQGAVTASAAVKSQIARLTLELIAYLEDT